ncbi:MAG: T9SS type A sorting domain-containing protein [Sphingobacteriales bacterium]|nr:T9SS type A sorting domain-containing protein [Sphingobacteriales bacterium]
MKKLFLHNSLFTLLSIAASHSLVTAQTCVGTATLTVSIAPCTCPASLNFVNGSNDYISGNNVENESSGNITATNVINAGATIVYDCGITSYVRLNPGFWAKSGSFFRAYPDGCGGVLKPTDTAEPILSEVPAVAKTQNPAAETPTTAALSAFPNPAHDEVNISITVQEAGTALVQLFDIQGKLTREIFSGNTEAGIHQFQVPLKSLPSGVYVVRYVQENIVKNLKLIVQQP